jgi:hypothetical protein
MQESRGSSSDASGSIDQRYCEIRDRNIRLGVQEAREAGIDIKTEPFKIAQQVQFPGNVDGENYWHVADYIIAEYSTRVGLQVAASFNVMVPQLGFDPYGKVMVGMQYVDRKAGTPTMFKYSFMREHPDFAAYVTEKHCPERTDKSAAFIGAAFFQFPSARHARQLFPSSIVVPEIKDRVVQKLASLDPEVGAYVAGL